MIIVVMDGKMFFSLNYLQQLYAILLYCLSLSCYFAFKILVLLLLLDSDQIIALTRLLSCNLSDIILLE